MQLGTTEPLSTNFHLLTRRPLVSHQREGVSVLVFKVQDFGFTLGDSS